MSLVDWTRVEEAFSSAALEPQHGAYTPKQLQEKEHVFPGAVLLVGRRGKVLYERAVGCRTILPEVTPMQVDTVFDISSLTKVIVTTTLVMQLVDKGQLQIDQALARIFQTFSTGNKAKMTVRHLLAHTSGYPAYIPFYKKIAELNEGKRSGIMCTRSAVEYVYNEIFRTNLDSPPGLRVEYSDVGFMLLAFVVETICGGVALDKLAQEKIFKRLGMKSTGYIELSKLRSRGLEPVTDMIAATVNCPWRKRLICGEVHDENAWAMGGVAGHAGVFSTARDIHKFSSEMMNCWNGWGSFIKKETVRKFWQRDESVQNSSRALGWDMPSGEESSAGKYFSREGVGHLGFTGCSLWMDPKLELDIILLSNRIHPNVDNENIKKFRPFIHDLILEALH